MSDGARAKGQCGTMLSLPLAVTPAAARWAQPARAHLAQAPGAGTFKLGSSAALMPEMPVASLERARPQTPGASLSPGARRAGLWERASAFTPLPSFETGEAEEPRRLRCH